MKKINKGFTLIELLLYLSIAAVMLLAISALISLLLQSRIKNQVIAEVEQQGMQIVELITQTIRNAEAINSPMQGASAVVLSLDVINISSDPTIFDVIDNTIHSKEGVANSIALTNGRVIVSDLLFSNLSRTNTPGTIRIQFTLTHINTDGRNEYEYSKKFYGSASLR